MGSLLRFDRTAFNANDTLNKRSEPLTAQTSLSHTDRQAKYGVPPGDLFGNSSGSVVPLVLFQLHCVTRRKTKQTAARERVRKTRGQKFALRRCRWASCISCALVALVDNVGSLQLNTSLAEMHTCSARSVFMHHPTPIAAAGVNAQTFEYKQRWARSVFSAERTSAMTCLSEPFIQNIRVDEQRRTSDRRHA